MYGFTSSYHLKNVSYNVFKAHRDMRKTKNAYLLYITSNVSSIYVHIPSSSECVMRINRKVIEYRVKLMICLKSYVDFGFGRWNFGDIYLN